MARRKRHSKHQAHVNHERWLVSYADFITLLFAFFVVLYSVSSVNEGKYRVLSHSLQFVFSTPPSSDKPIQVGDPQTGNPSYIGDAASMAVIDNDLVEGPGIENPPVVPVSAETEAEGDDGQEWSPMAEQKRLGYIAGSIESVLSPYVEQGLVDVQQDLTRVSVTLNNKMLFGSASADLAGPAVKALTDVAHLLRSLPNPIQVEGYTDNLPIRTAAYPSNWVLSAARAASVVHLFERVGIRPERMAATGYGEHRPVQSNATEEGRAANRRIALIIMANGTGDDVRELSQKRTAEEN